MIGMRCLLGIIISFFCFPYAFAEQPPIFVGSREGDPESIVKNISSIHADYSELEVDLCIPGPDPLIVSRFYTSKDTLDIATFGGWRFQPQTLFFLCQDPDCKGNQNIYVGMSEGSLLKFSGSRNWDNSKVQSKFVVDLGKDEVGICNTAKVLLLLGQIPKITFSIMSQRVNHLNST